MSDELTQRLLVATLSAFLLVGCGGPEEDATPESPTVTTAESVGDNEGPPDEAPPEEPPQVDESAQARVATDTYVVELRPTDGYQAGQLGQFSLHVAGEGEWHLNQLFPFSVRVAHGDDVTFPKDTLGKTDAAEFTDDLARLDVPFTAGAGEHPVSAVVEFAVCNPESCVPQTATVGLRLAVAE